MATKFDARAVCRSLLDAESEADVQEVIEINSRDGQPQELATARWPRDEFQHHVQSSIGRGQSLDRVDDEHGGRDVDEARSAKEDRSKGKNAPATMHTAVDKLIKNLRGGKLTNLKSKDPWLREFAQKNLIIGVTGARSKRRGFPAILSSTTARANTPKASRAPSCRSAPETRRTSPSCRGSTTWAPPGSSAIAGSSGSS